MSSVDLNWEEYAFRRFTSHDGDIKYEDAFFIGFTERNTAEVIMEKIKSMGFPGVTFWAGKKNYSNLPVEIKVDLLTFSQRNNAQLMKTMITKLEGIVRQYNDSLLQFNQRTIQLFSI